MLEVLAPGGRERVDDVAACFCTGILGLPELPPRKHLKLYDLEPIKSPDVAFPTDPRDGIDRVELREVRLSLPRDRGWKRRVTFSVDPRACERAIIHDMILDTIRPDGVTLDEVLVTAARFTLVFAPVDNQRPKRLTFEVGWPDRCTLKDNYRDHVARKCLRRWGLVLDTHPAQAPARRGPQA